MTGVDCTPGSVERDRQCHHREAFVTLADLLTRDDLPDIVAWKVQTEPLAGESCAKGQLPPDATPASARTQFAAVAVALDCWAMATEPGHDGSYTRMEVTGRYKGLKVQVWAHIRGPLEEEK